MRPSRQLMESFGEDALRVLEEGQEQVDLFNLRIAVLLGGLLGGPDGFGRFLGQFFRVHKAVTPFRGGKLGFVVWRGKGRRRHHRRPASMVAVTKKRGGSREKREREVIVGKSQPMAICRDWGTTGASLGRVSSRMPL